jgi:hypothetical protein
MYATRKPKARPHRVSPRPPARFGAGLLSSTPTTRLSVPLSDLEWATMSQDLEPASDWDEDTQYDQMYDESRAIDALCAGLIPDDMAIVIERTSLVGHRP